MVKSLKNHTKKWKDLTIEQYPAVGTKCLVYGIQHGSYGYTDDREIIYRCEILPLKQSVIDNELKPNVDILESTDRYFCGFTPLKYKRM